MIAVILLTSITIAIMSVLHTISLQASSAVYSQGSNNINSSIYNLASNGTLANILSNNLVNYLNESASIIKLTSMIPDVSNAEFANKINSSLHVIASKVSECCKMLSAICLFLTSSLSAIPCKLLLILFANSALLTSGITLVSFIIEADSLR